MVDFTLKLPPQEWTDVLQAIRVGPASLGWNGWTSPMRFWPYGNSLLGGGCLRDHILGRPISDIDVFLDGTGETSVSFCATLSAILGLKVEEDKTVNFNNVIYPATFGTIAFAYINGMKYQFIQKCHNIWAKSLVDTFDIGLCMICWDGVKYTYSPWFTLDATMETLTLVHPKEHSSKGHQRRVREKYPDFKFIETPDHNLIKAYQALAA